MATGTESVVAASGLLHFLGPALETVTSAARREAEAKEEKEKWLQLISEATTRGHYTRLRFHLTDMRHPVASSKELGDRANFKKRLYIVTNRNGKISGPLLEGILLAPNGAQNRPEFGGWGWLIAQAGEYHFVPLNAGRLVAVAIGNDMAALPDFDTPFDHNRKPVLGQPLEEL